MLIDKKIILRCQKYLRVVNQDDIICCKSEDCYTQFYLLTGESPLISKPLAQFCKELDPNVFIRVSQSYLVNCNHIKMVDKKNKEIEMLDKSSIKFNVPIKTLITLIEKGILYLCLGLINLQYTFNICALG